MDDRISPPTAPTTAGDSRPPAGAADQPREGDAARQHSTRNKVIIGIAAAAGLYLLWIVSLQFMAYTSDAFVATDVVRIAPEVAGRITAVHVVDNQFVHKGDPLIDLDPTPYALLAELRAADLAKAEADEQYAVRAVARTQADLDTNRAALGFSRRTEQRYGNLVQQGAISQLAFDEARTKRNEAETKLRAAEATLDAARQTVTAQRATIDVARRALDRARYDLQQTHIVAPISGYINNLWLRVGDYARVGEPRVGIVADDTWWVVALYKEEAIRHLAEGQPVWIHLDIYPYRIFRGRVQGIARGIAREDRQTDILPDIAPTTGWIRFQRRLPVRIVLEDVPADVRLHVGANARTLAIYGW